MEDFISNYSFRNCSNAIGDIWCILSAIFVGLSAIIGFLSAIFSKLSAILVFLSAIFAILSAILSFLSAIFRDTIMDKTIIRDEDLKEWFLVALYFYMSFYH
ncbi:hypothetical protein AMS59_14180 [Lysinibacillus sp. FJAT-14745]|uniref:hypothetical protein n=1 Tax=Lysinibacillus sp. FJAT-14745 TaxID=1704289 RepID=UPI0006ABE5BB|nr:hypothetical protein [Lysinibacillus sp. FJAT-14745]KOP77787.1 hypothetical protein AMS59_14180 [Lysinibacillus sp. FJAT-14745]